MENNLAQKLVDEKIESLSKKKIEIDDEINKINMRDKTSLMALRKSIIYDNFQSKRKIRMGILKLREVVNNYVYAARTNKLLKEFDEYFKISEQDVSDYHQDLQIKEFAPDCVFEYIEHNKKDYYNEIMLIKH